MSVSSSWKPDGGVADLIRAPKEKVANRSKSKSKNFLFLTTVSVECSTWFFLFNSPENVPRLNYRSPQKVSNNDESKLKGWYTTGFEKWKWTFVSPNMVLKALPKRKGYTAGVLVKQNRGTFHAAKSGFHNLFYRYFIGFLKRGINPVMPPLQPDLVPEVSSCVSTFCCWFVALPYWFLASDAMHQNPLFRHPRWP